MPGSRNWHGSIEDDRLPEWWQLDRNLALLFLDDRVDPAGCPDDVIEEIRQQAYFPERRHEVVMVYGDHAVST